MRVRRTDHDRVRLDPARFLDLRPRVEHQLARNHQRVRPDQCDLAAAIVEHRDAHLARIMKRFVKCFSVAAWLFHADARRDIPLRKSRLDAGAGGLVRRSRRVRQPTRNDDQDDFSAHARIKMP
jgi:hypothetical protein